MYNNDHGQQPNRMVLEEQQGELELRSALYLAKVMGWMCVGLLTTVVAAMACLNVPAIFTMVFGSGFGVMGIFVAQILVVIMLSSMINKMSPAMATVMFMVYAGLMGLTMSVFVLAYELASLLTAFGVATFVFLTMAVYGFTTKKDLTGIGRLAFFGLLGVILAGVVNFVFLRNTLMDFAVTCIGIVVFIGLTAYDTQKIKHIYQTATVGGYDEDSDELRKLAIFGALTLYLDFINLFLKLLRLLGRRR